MGKINWQKTISRRETPLRSELIGKGAALYIPELLHVENNNFLFYFDCGQGSAYFDPIQIQRMGKIIASSIQSTPSFLTTHTQGLVDRSSHLVKLSEEIGSQNVSTFSFGQLETNFDAFVKAHFSFSPYMMTAIAVEKVVTQIVKERLLKNSLIAGDTNKLDQYLNILVSPSKFPAVIEGQREIEQLAKMVKTENAKSIATAIRNHWTKYSFLGVYCPSDEPYSLDYFKQKLQETIISPKPLKNESLIQVDKETGIFIAFLQEYVYLRTFRVEQLSRSYYFIQPLLREIAKRAGISLYELCLCSLDEIHMFLQKQTCFDPVTLQKRKNTYLYTMKNGIFQCYSGREAQHQFQQEVKEESVDTVKTIIQGSVACKGKANGRVHIILDPKDIHTFGKGEILVTIMTNPDYTTVMGKAAAIVTEEGGMLCHAAIVSRELNVPCVVGTGNATKILKDGDIVEVDANTGTVRIVQRKI